MADQPDVAITLTHTGALTETQRSGARALLFEVFDDMTEFDWEHSLGGMHAIASVDGSIIGHASLIQRRLGYRAKPLRAGYVEGVAVREDHRRQGVGSALMAPLEQLILRAYDLGALGATDEAMAFYTGRGWQRWTGLSYALTLEGIVRTQDDDGGIFVLPGTIPLDLYADLVADWRDDCAW